MMKPQPKYGWRGQTPPDDDFPVGTKVYITGGLIRQATDALAEVIEFGTPPNTIKHIPDLVHLRILESNNSLFHKGFEEYWENCQLELADG